MSLKRTVLRNLTLQGASQVVSLSAGLIVSLILSRHLGPAGFGAFNYVFTYLYFFLTLNDLGVNTIVVREVSKDESRGADVIGAMLAFRGIAALVALAAASLVAWWMPLEPPLRTAILLFAWILPLNAMNLPATIFQVKLRVEYATVADVVNRVGGLALVLLAVRLDAGLTGIFGALLAAEAAGVAVALILSRRFVRPRVHVNVALWREVLRSSLPLGIAGLLAAVVNRIDFLMLERLAGLEQLGLYSAAYKVTSLVERFPQLLMMTIYPVMSKVAAVDHVRLRAVYRKTTMHLAAVALPLAGVVTWLAPELVGLFGSQYSEAATALRVLIWASVCLYLALAGGHILISIGRERISLATLVAGAAANIALNLLWIPRMGYVGAALATVVAFGVILVTTLVAVEFYLPRSPLASLAPGDGAVGQ